MGAQAKAQSIEAAENLFTRATEILKIKDLKEAEWDTCNFIMHGDARVVLGYMPNGLVHTIVTSPPYYGQRDYEAPGQIGNEETPADYVVHLVTIFREARRVLRDDGTLWLNIGDKYLDNGLLGLPWRVALALIDDGWVLRSDQYHANWISYRSSEALKHEKYLYLGKAGPYAAAKDPHGLLAERIESLVSLEHAKWASGQENIEKVKAERVRSG
jgi:DNA modification methylase